MTSNARRNSNPGDTQTSADLSRFGQPLAPEWTVSNAFARPSGKGRSATVTADLLSGRAALSKRNGTVLAGYGADTLPRNEAPPTTPTHYRMGFHFTPCFSRQSGKLHYLPTMWGAGESEVILYPNGGISIRIGKSSSVPGVAFPRKAISHATIER